MRGVNKVVLIGNLGRDPEMRYTQSGTAVTTLSVATSEQWTGEDGKKQERTEWHRVVAWGKLAEICGKYLTKGRQIYVEGKIRTREWQDQKNNKRRTTEVVADQLVMLGTKSETAPLEEQLFGGGREPGSDDEDVPF